ncbi:MAG: ABC transporter ATP-binding protein [Eubacterium sp.]|nr:ABC transporter ATP-binding protein [Eubacterium sp.]
MGKVLQYQHVDIAYRGNTVIHDVSFSVEDGEILGIVGESGSGKSTLLRAAMGLLGDTGMVTQGDIWYKGKDLPDLSDAKRRTINGPGIGMIFQNAGSSFCPVRTIGSQLYEAMTEHTRITRKAFQATAVDTLGKLGFHDAPDLLARYPFELSGGMQQRIGIAAAVLLHPEIILADEPTSALDVTVQKQVVQELLKIRQLYHTAMLLVTHNIGVVNAMADHVLVLKEGRVVEYGETEQVLRHPNQEYTRRLMDAVPRIRRGMSS